MSTSAEPELLKEELYEAIRIQDSAYTKADLTLVISNIKHLNSEEKSQLKALLEKHESLFEGKLGLWDTDPIHLQFEENAKPFYTHAFPIPHIHEATIRKECDRLCTERVIAKDANSEWAAPTFIVPKKEGTIRFITDFRQLNRALK